MKTRDHNTKIKVAKSLLVFMLVTNLMSCSGTGTVTSTSSSSSSSDTATNTDTESSSPPSLALAASAIAGVFSSIASNTTNLVRLTLVDESANVCGTGASDPDSVESLAYGFAGTYGAADHDMEVDTDDYCELEDGTGNTGTGPDSDGLFRSFRVSIATSVCGDAGETTNVYLRSGEGIYRNTADYYPEIYGSFTVAGTELNCTIKLNEDGSTAESYCTDSDNNLIEVTDPSINCVLTPGVVAPETSGYNGIWAPAIMQEGWQSMDNPEALLEIGADFVSVVASGVVSADGSVTLYNSDEEIADKILDFYDYGIGVFLSFDSTYSAEGGSGNPSAPQIPESVIEGTDVLDNLTSVALNLAELAEEYDVYLFAPYNEADFKLDDGEDNYSSSWSQDVIAGIRERYTGTVLWKAAYTMEGISHIDFSGYDAAGISLSRSADETDEQYRERVTDTMADLVNQAEEGQLLFISEFGVWGDSDETMIDEGREQDIVDAYDIVLDEGQGLIDGFIAFDGPEGYEPPLYDDDNFAEDADTFDTVKTWFGGGN